MTDKKLVIWPGVNFEHALLALEYYKRLCTVEEWRNTANSYQNFVEYTFDDGYSVVVYQTKTSYVIRSNS